MTKKEAIKKYILDYEGKPSVEKSSVHYGDTTRIEKAIEQAGKKPESIKKIIELTNEFLKLLEMPQAPEPVLNYPNAQVTRLNFYERFKEEHNLDDEGDIVWMKFTKDGYLGLVAVSNDIGFSTPVSASHYNEKTDKGEWLYTTGGIIIHMLGKQWDESFVLVFPLTNIPDDLKRGDIECGIGNYLTDNNTPILDYYSHRF